LVQYGEVTTADDGFGGNEDVEGDMCGGRRLEIADPRRVTAPRLRAVYH
jgi:hypothetical protein